MAAAATRFTLAGRRALITGGTKGIGRATVDEFLNLGAKVFLVSRTKDEVAAVTKELQKKWGETTVGGFAGDVSNEDGRKQVMDKAMEFHGGQLNDLVNNVGTGSMKSTLDITLEEQLHLVNTNFISAYGLAQLAAPFLKRPVDDPSKFSSIVGLSSVLATRTTNLASPLYSATKAAIDVTTKHLAVEWASAGVRVNAVAPWFVETPFATALVLGNKDVRQEIENGIPMRRVGKPEEIASVAAFLCTPAASFLTGQSITIDGGFTSVGYAPIWATGSLG